MIKNVVKRTKGGGVVANTRYDNCDIKREVELKISSKGYSVLR